MNHDQRGTPPVSQGEEVDVYIESVGGKGDGVAKRKGFVIFIPGAKQGQNVRIKITKVLASVAFGEVIGEAQGPVERNERPRTNLPDPEPEEVYEDSEDFGEEDDDAQ